MQDEDATPPPAQTGYPVITGYLAQEDGRVAFEEAPATEDASTGANASEGPDAGADPPFWKRLGFASFQANLDEVERLRDLYEPRPRRRRSFAELPGEELGKLVVPRREPLSHQVNVKLRIEDSHSLRAAAADFGVAPTTLARLIVERGLEVIPEWD